MIDPGRLDRGATILALKKTLNQLGQEKLSAQARDRGRQIASGGGTVQPAEPGLVIVDIANRTQRGQQHLTAIAETEETFAKGPDGAAGRHQDGHPGKDHRVLIGFLPEAPRQGVGETVRRLNGVEPADAADAHAVSLVSGPQKKGTSGTCPCAKSLRACSRSSIVLI